MSRTVPTAGLLLIAASMCLASIAYGQAAQLESEPGSQRLEVSGTLQKHAFGDQVSYLVDPSQELTLEDISAFDKSRFTPTAAEVPSYGFEQAAYWFRFDVHNTSDTALHWLLEIAYPHLDYLDLYAPLPGGGYRHGASGDRRVFSSRDLAYRNVIFDVNSEPGTHTYFLRVQTSGPLTVPLVAWSPRAFADALTVSQPMLWMFFGLILVMAVYNLFIYFSVRELPYLHYFFYIFSFAWFQFTLNGLSFQYLWPESPSWSNRFMPTSIGLGFLTGILFIRSFLETPKAFPRGDKLLLVCGVGGGSTAIALAQLAPGWLSIRFAVANGIAAVIFTVPLAITLALRGQRQARFFIAAWVLFLTGIAMYLLKAVGVIPSNAITEWTIQIGAALEVVLLSLGLADRINRMRDKLHVLNGQLVDNVKELTEALDAAEVARKAKSAFLAGVSHELRTPLNAIINIPEGLIERFEETPAVRCTQCDSLFELDEGEQVDLNMACPSCDEPRLASAHCIQFTGEPESTRDHLKHVHAAGKHLLEVVSDVLDISKLEAGKMGVHLEDVELYDVLRDAIEPMVPFAETQGVELQFSASSAKAGATRVRGDAIKLKQIILNLVGNAVKFSDGRGTVDVDLSQAGSNYRIAVRDRGIGIAGSDIDQIFEGFVQAESGDTRRFGGTGLGLAITKQLVELHNGTIWVESELGHGACFYVELPMAESTVESLEPLEPVEHKEPDQTDSSGNRVGSQAP